MICYLNHIAALFVLLGPHKTIFTYDIYKVAGYYVFNPSTYKIFLWKTAFE